MATVHAETLRLAAEIAGGLTELSTQLGVPERAVEEWLQGTQPIPPNIFLRAVDIVASYEINEIRDSYVKIIRAPH
jgi:hypothetical protein